MPSAFAAFCMLPSALCLLLLAFSFFLLARWCVQATVPCPQRPTPPCTQFGTLAQGCPWRGPCNPIIDMPTGFFPWAAQFLLDAEVQHFSLARWCGQATAPCPQRPTGLSTTAHPPAAPASADSISRRRAAPHRRKFKKQIRRDEGHGLGFLVPLATSLP